jgi:hypothetical protein
MLKENINYNKKENYESRLKVLNKNELWNIIVTSIIKYTRACLTGKKSQ